MRPERVLGLDWRSRWACCRLQLFAECGQAEDSGTLKRELWTGRQAVSQEAMFNFAEVVREKGKVAMVHKVYEGAPHLLTHWPACREQLAIDIADWIVAQSSAPRS